MLNISITPFGFVYIILAIIAFCRSYQAIAKIFAFSYLFQTTAIFAIGNTGFMPYLIGPILLTIKGLRLKKEVPQDVKNIQTISIIFILFVIVQSFTAKYFFEGNVLVYEQGGMETAIAKGMVPYHFSLKQCIQWIYLILNIGGLISILKHRQYLDSHFSKKIIEQSVLFISFIGIWKYIADNFGGWFPDSFFFNNISFDLGNIWQSVGGKMRFTSIFVEASICGLFLALFWWNTFFTKIKNKIFILSIALLCLLLTVASTGFFCFLFGAALYLIKKRNIKVIVFLFLIGAFFYGLAQYLNLLDTVYDMTINKSESQSAEVRSEIMMSGLQIFKDTYGLGIGLGASNGSGLALTLLGQIGILGCSLFIGWLYFIVKYLNNRQIKMQLGLWVVLFGMCTSVGYLSFPIFWIELIIICSIKSNSSTHNNIVQAANNA
jgi:hypothetical protein